VLSLVRRMHEALVIAFGSTRISIDCLSSLPFTAVFYLDSSRAATPFTPFAPNSITTCNPSSVVERRLCDWRASSPVHYVGTNVATQRNARNASPALVNGMTNVQPRQ